MITQSRSVTIEKTVNPISLSSKAGRYLAPVLLAVGDYTVVVVALLTAWFLRAELLPILFSQLPPFHISNAFIYLMTPATYLLFLNYADMYTKRMPFWQSAEIIFKVCSYVSISSIVIMYAIGTEEHVSRLFVGTSWILSFICLCIVRYFSKRLLSFSGLWQKPIVLIGAGKTAEILAKNFAEEPGMGYKIVGLVEDSVDRPLVQQFPHLGTFRNAEQLILKSGVQDVIIATPGLEREQLIDLVYRIQPIVRNISIVPDLFGIPVNNMSVEKLLNERTVLLKLENNMTKVRNRVLKRTFDFLGSLCGIVAIAPVLFFIAIAIYISSPGPIIFSHMRIGLSGKLFPCYKFRSMVANAQEVLEEYLASNHKAREEWDKDFKLKNDPRITKIGHLLRKTSLDELPQLLNVLRGEMSLVGPRPIVDKEIVKYGDYIKDYYLVRPGMTGYWQVSGRNDVDYDTRVNMDSWYVRNWSIWQDVVLLFKTVGVVFGKKGAY